MYGIIMPRSVKKTVQDLSRDMERLLVDPRTRSSDVARISETLTDDQDEEEEEPFGASGDHQELCQTRNILEEIPDDVTTVGSPAAPHNSLETSVIDLCDETILSTNNETVSEVSQEGDSELEDNIDLPAPEEIILIDDDEDEGQSVEEAVNMFEAQGRVRVDTTIVISESEEEQEHEEEHDVSAEGGNLDETLNILTIKCPICLAGFREIQAEGGSLCSTICGHIFCKSCLDGCRGAEYHSYFKCPSCRRSLRDRDYHPIFLS